MGTLQSKKQQCEKLSLASGITPDMVETYAKAMQMCITLKDYCEANKLQPDADDRCSHSVKGIENLLNIWDDHISAFEHKWMTSAKNGHSTLQVLQTACSCDINLVMPGFSGIVGNDLAKRIIYVRNDTRRNLEYALSKCAPTEDSVVLSTPPSYHDNGNDKLNH